MLTAICKYCILNMGLENLIYASFKTCQVILVLLCSLAMLAICKDEAHLDPLMIKGKILLLHLMKKNILLFFWDEGAFLFQ